MATLSVRAGRVLRDQSHQAGDWARKVEGSKEVQKKNTIQETT
jgi:hypothetical protein